MSEEMVGERSMWGEAAAAVPFRPDLRLPTSYVLNFGEGWRPIPPPASDGNTVTCIPIVG